MSDLKKTEKIKLTLEEISGALRLISVLQKDTDVIGKSLHNSNGTYIFNKLITRINKYKIELKDLKIKLLEEKLK